MGMFFGVFLASEGPTCRGPNFLFKRDIDMIPSLKFVFLPVLLPSIFTVLDRVFIFFKLEILNFAEFFQVIFFRRILVEQKKKNEDFCEKSQKSQKSKIWASSRPKMKKSSKKSF